MEKNLPNVKFRVRVKSKVGVSYEWGEYTTNDYFGKGKSVLFSLPGAFTPTCTNFQLPGFDLKFSEFQKHGVDNIYCMSVNDSFVMNAWKSELKIKNVEMIPDGNGDFTSRMGMLCNKRHLGFGHRSWRYACVIEDGNIIAWFEEKGYDDSGLDNDPYSDNRIDSDPYEETKPENVLEWLEKNSSPDAWPFPTSPVSD